MAGRWAVAWLTAIDGVPAKMLRSKSAVCGVRGRDVARLWPGWAPGSREALVMPGWGRGGRVLQCMDEAEGSHFSYVFDPILLRYWGIGGLVHVLSKL